MAYTKQTWENLPSTNSPITADRLNHMEDGIYNAYEINNSYSTSQTKGYSCNYINEKIEDTYSTTETLTNKTFLGSPVYRKILTANSLANDGSLSINHGISNLETVIKCEYFWYDTMDSRWYYGIRYEGNNSIYITLGSITSTQVSLRCAGVDWSTRTRDVNIILEYTKSS